MDRIKLHFNRAALHIRNVFHQHKYYFIYSLALAILYIFIITFGLSAATKSSHTLFTLNGFRVSIDSEELGFVRSPQAVVQSIENFGDDLDWFKNDKDLYKLLQYQAATIQVTRKWHSAVEKNLIRYLKPRAKASYITVSNRNILALASEQEARQTVKTIIDRFTPRQLENISQLQVVIQEDISYTLALVPREDIFSPEDAVHFLLQGTTEKKTYKVLKKDTAWGVAKRFKMNTQELQTANPKKNLEKIYPGDILNLIVPKPFLKVHTEYRQEYPTSVPYRTVIHFDRTLIRTRRKLLQRGVPGQKLVTARMVFENGELLEKKILNETILTYPKRQIIKQGTKLTPDDILVSKAFLGEKRSYITSFFGPRWGRFHSGIDIAAPVGTEVLAYRAGTVKKAYYDKLFGLVIVLDHGNGLATLYGHNKKLLVKKGDKVEAGTLIALSGSSGYSTGPHVHFEVHINNTKVDPLTYLQQQAILSDQLP